jgi:hypothetical protein
VGRGQGGGCYDIVVVSVGTIEYVDCRVDLLHRIAYTGCQAIIYISIGPDVDW